jgi:hypothetical protein
MEDEIIKTLRKLNRERIHSIWELAKNGNLDILTGEEGRYAEVMLEHEEEYFNQFEMADLTYNYQYDPDTEENPFLHIALHVVVENQLEAGQPTEVYQFYDSMRKRKCSHHDAIHLIAALLAPLIVIALQRNGAPDEELYRSLLRKYKGKKPEKIWALMDKDLGPLLQK